MELLPILFGVVVVAFALIAQSNRNQKRDAVWRQLADQRNMAYSPGSFFDAPTLSGTIDDCRVDATVVYHKHGKSNVPYAQVAVTPAVLAPSGLHLSVEGVGAALLKMVGGQDIQVGDLHFDGKARVRGQNPEDIQALFADTQLRRTCQGLFSSSRFNTFADGRVVLEARSRSGDEIRSLLDQGLKIAHAFDQARLRPWQHLADTHGLKLQVSNDKIAATGSFDGLSIEARSRLPLGRTVITVQIPTAMPTGLRVVSGEMTGAVPLGDPILNGMVSARGAVPEAVRTLLRGDVLRGDLLAVLHAFPGSQVVGQRVEMVLPVGSTADLVERVRDACRLATALTRQAQETGAASLAARAGQKTQT